MHLQSYNHLKYRGYYHDTETGFYYLNSRYYDPVIGRFINADDVSVFNIEQGNMLQYNLYTYCLNNPVDMVDNEGKMAGTTGVISGTLYKIIMAGLESIACTNAWNTIGWIAVGIVGVATVIDIGVSIYSNYKEKKQIAIEKAHAAILDTVKEDSKERYWTATIRNDWVDIGRAISFEEAVFEVANGRDVFTVTKTEAKEVARAAGGNATPVGSEKHGKGKTIGYYPHYHPYRRKGGHVLIIMKIMLDFASYKKLIYVPDGSVQDIERLQTDFDEWVRKQPECWEEWMYGGKVCSFDAVDFLRYLNENVLKGTDKKAYFCDMTNEDTESENTLYF